MALGGVGGPNVRDPRNIEPNLPEPLQMQALFGEQLEFGSPPVLHAFLKLGRAIPGLRDLHHQLGNPTPPTGWGWTLRGNKRNAPEGP